MSDTAKIISLPNERRLTFVTFADVDEHARRDWLVRESRRPNLAPSVPQIGTATNDAARPQGPMMGGPSRLIRFPNRTNATNSEGARK
jgi:hypothetical protein